METYITAFIAAGLGALITGMFTRRKNEADASKAVSDAAVNLVAPLSARVDCMEKDQERLKRTLTKAMNRIAYLMGGIAQLTQQITEAGHTPVWTPDNWDVDEEC